MLAVLLILQNLGLADLKSLVFLSMLMNHDLMKTNILSVYGRPVLIILYIPTHKPVTTCSSVII